MMVVARNELSSSKFIIIEIFRLSNTLTVLVIFISVVLLYGTHM